MTRPLRVGFLSGHNPHDRNSFSGTPHYMLRALQARPDLQVRVLGPHRPPRPGLLGRIGRRLARPAPPIGRADIDDRDLDVILAPVASGLVAAFADDLAAPVVLLTDATPAFLREFYGRPVPPEADATETRALDRAAAVVYSSDYMAARARREFDLAPGKVHVVPFGLNLDRLPAAPQAKPPFDPLNLLFIGQDWQRKGGAIALAALEALVAAGTRVRLTLIGSASPEALAHPAVEALGYLDKNDPRQAARFETALAEAHVFLLPTRADCTPMVVAEANAHACPVLITDTGGIGSLMAPGRNGRMLPWDADGAAWAQAIREITADPVAYRDLSRRSFEHCRARLTWDAWAGDLSGLLRDLAEGARP